MNASPRALIRVSHGPQGVAEREDGVAVPCRFRRQVGRPICGDQVVLAPQADGPDLVVEILPRRNEFFRGDDRQRPRAVAANLDRVLVVVASRPAPSRDLVERYLVAVHSLGIEPILVLNKVDLPLPEEDSGAGALRHLADYERLGYRVVRTSCKAAPGLTQLEPELHGRASILVGQSGVGKSSLVRCLLPDLDVQVGELSRATGKGTHTTSTTTLYRLPGGGSLIDSPGVWEYGLWRIEEDALARGFIEFHPALGGCRFNDCRHASEPGCAVKDAVAGGRIADWRYQAYLRLLEQNRTGFG